MGKWKVLLAVAASLVVWVLLTSQTAQEPTVSIPPDSYSPTPQASFTISAPPDDASLAVSPKKRDLSWLPDTILLGLLGWALITIYQRITKDIDELKKRQKEDFNSSLNEALRDETVKKEIKSVIGDDLVTLRSFNDTLRNAITTHRPTEDAIKEIAGSKSNEDIIQIFKNSLEENSVIRSSIQNIIGLREDQVRILTQYADLRLNEAYTSAKAAIHKNENEPDIQKDILPNDIALPSLDDYLNYPYDDYQI